MLSNAPVKGYALWVEGMMSTLAGESPSPYREVSVERKVGARREVR